MSQKDDEIIDIMIEELDFCSCGDPERILTYIQKYLTMLNESEWKSHEDDEYIFFVHWANKNDYADHGTTARCSWLTPAGKRLLERINNVLKL